MEREPEQQKRRTGWVPKALLILLIGLLLEAGFMRFFMLHNETESMPVGQYVKVPWGGFERGDIVAACLPPAQHALAEERHYLKDTGPCDGQQAIIKVIAAGPGDVVDVLPQAVCVNGMQIHNSTRWSHDDTGRFAIPAVPPGRVRLSAGNYWLESPKAGSWDSRYFGAIEQRYVISRLIYLGRETWPITYDGQCKAGRGSTRILNF